MNTALSLYDTIQTYAEQQPTKGCLSVDGNELSYAQIFEQSTAVKNALSQRGINSGDRVAIILPNSLEWYLSFVAVTALGAIPVPLDPQIGSWELESVQNVVEVSAIICCESFRAVNHLKSIDSLTQHPGLVICTNECERGSETTPFSSLLLSQSGEEKSYNKTLMLASTSGTTGNPKIIEVPQQGFLKSQWDMGEYLEMTPDDTMLLGMPLYHQGGFGMGIQGTLHGASLIYQERFTPTEFLKTIEEKGVTIVQLTPTLAKMVLSTPDLESYSLDSVRLAYFAGESLSDEVAREFWEKRNIRVVNVVGSTETGTIVAWDSRSDNGVDPSILSALPFSSVKIINDQGALCPQGEPGEILVHTEGVLLSYYGNKSESNRKIQIDEQERRWFHSGDLAQFEKDGKIAYKGRIKRIIKRGANLIYPEELETFLHAHSAIKDVVITSEKDPVFGEKIIANVVPQNSEAPVTRGDLLRYCRGSIAAYKTPDEVITIKDIPMNKGKVDFKRLKQIKELEGEIS